jgi:thiaminase/transcriptional activator TenA
MGFSEQLREEAGHLFEAAKRHPFVEGMAAATLTPSQLIHYVRQDAQYLDTYIRIYGLGIAKCPAREQMRDLHRRIALVLDSEVVAHENLCRVAGADYAELRRGVEPAPAAHHYACHMLSVAQGGTLGEILATVLPCHWMYAELAEHLCEGLRPGESHPYREWMTFYRSDSVKAGLRELIDWLDAYALDAGPREREFMRQAFLYSCRLEIRFFDMSIAGEVW